MKINKTLTALITGASLGLSGQAFAEGTTSGTSITNNLSISYTVDSEPQTPASNDTTFLVDTKVDFTLILQSSASQDVTPNKDYTAKYLLTNTSNSDLDFNLTSADISDGNITVGDPNAAIPVVVADNTDLNTISIRAENDGEYDTGSAAPVSTFASGTDLASSNISIQADFAHIIYVYVNIDGASTDNDIATAELTVTAASGTTDLVDSKGTANIQNGTAQIVFADLDFDGFETINAGFEIVSADFTHRNVADTADLPNPGLTFKVINDTICDNTLVATTTKVDYSAAGCTITFGGTPTTYFPKALPGAMVEFTIKTENTGGADAKSVTLTQSLLSSHVDNIDLQAASIRNVTPVYVNDSGDIAGDGNTTAAVSTASSTNDVASVTVDDFEAGDSITITFTAIVE